MIHKSVLFADMDSTRQQIITITSCFVVALPVSIGPMEGSAGNVAMPMIYRFRGLMNMAESMGRE